MVVFKINVRFLLNEIQIFADSLVLRFVPKDLCLQMSDSFIVFIIIRVFFTRALNI
eukprot:SAG31_NODE_2745_length_5147_cov_20.624604_8_plen_56_part_00